MPGSEKRRFKRINLRMKTNIYSETGRLVAKGQIQNICEDGICFIADREFKPGVTAVFEYKISEFATPLKITARIIWVKRFTNVFYHGAKFEKVGFWHKIKLKKYIRMYLKSLDSLSAKKLSQKKTYKI